MLGEASTTGGTVNRFSSAGLVTALLALALVLVTAVFKPAYRAAHIDAVAALRAD